MLKIFQTSDIHIGAKLGWLRSKADEQRVEILHTFSRIVEETIKQKAKLLLIVGDLFDTPYPSQVSVSFVKNELDKLEKNFIYTVILPGNHDKLELGSVYLSKFANTQYIKIFQKKDIEVFDFAEIGVSVYAHAHQDKETFKKLKGFYSRYPGKLSQNIAMIHSGIQTARGFLTEVEITKEDIQNSGFDYIALGDWHQPLEVSSEKTVSWYSGSPEILAKDQHKAGNYLEIDFASQVPVVTISKISKRKIENTILDLDKEKYGQNQDLEQKIIDLIQERADTNTIQILQIKGKKDIAQKYDLENIKKIFKDQFFFLEVVDESEFKLDPESLEKYPQELIVGRFIQTVTDKIKKEQDEEEVEILKMVLQEGIKVLTE